MSANTSIPHSPDVIPNSSQPIQKAPTGGKYVQFLDIKNSVEYAVQYLTCGPNIALESITLFPEGYELKNTYDNAAREMDLKIALTNYADAIKAPLQFLEKYINSQNKNENEIKPDEVYLDMGNKDILTQLELLDTYRSEFLNKVDFIRCFQQKCNESLRATARDIRANKYPVGKSPKKFAYKVTHG